MKPDRAEAERHKGCGGGSGDPMTREDAAYSLASLA